jgi:hypothetical protein
MGLVSDKLVCGWNNPGTFLDELRKTTKLRITSRRSAYGVKPVTNELQQPTITAARVTNLPTASTVCTGLLAQIKAQPAPNKHSRFTTHSAVSLHLWVDARGIEFRLPAGT